MLGCQRHGSLSMRLCELLSFAVWHQCRILCCNATMEATVGHHLTRQAFQVGQYMQTPRGCEYCLTSKWTVVDRSSVQHRQTHINRKRAIRALHVQLALGKPFC